MIRKFFTFLLIFFFAFRISAQETKDDLSRLQSGEDLNVMYRNEQSFGVFVHTMSGLGIGYRRGKHITGKIKRMYEIEAQNFKHPKEIKTINTYYDNSKGFIYGKLNSMLIVRPGIGLQKTLYKKSDKKSVEIRYSYFVGGALAFAKPVYLEIKKNNSPLNQPPTTERYNPEEHSIDEIYGKAPFFRGIEKTRIFPGGYAKLALSFEYADRYNGLKAIETGVTLDVYPRIIPIMAYNKNQQVFISLYLKMIWGKKWF